MLKICDWINIDKLKWPEKINKNEIEILKLNKNIDNWNYECHNILTILQEEQKNVRFIYLEYKNNYA